MQSLSVCIGRSTKKKYGQKNGITHLELIGFPVPVLVRLPANRPIFSSAQRGSTSIYQAHFRRQDIFLIESVVHQRLPPLWPLIQAYRQGHLRLTGFVLNRIPFLHCEKKLDKYYFAKNQLIK